MFLTRFSNASVPLMRGLRVTRNLCPPVYLQLPSAFFTGNISSLRKLALSDTSSDLTHFVLSNPTTIEYPGSLERISSDCLGPQIISKLRIGTAQQFGSTLSRPWGFRSEKAETLPIFRWCWIIQFHWRTRYTILRTLSNPSTANYIILGRTDGHPILLRV